MAQEQLHGSQVLRTPVDQRRLGAQYRMRTVVSGIKAKFFDPAFDNPRLLPRAQMRRVVEAARKQEVLRP